jgi:hypothetical protein
MYETRYQMVEAIQRQRREEAEEARLAARSVAWQRARAARVRHRHARWAVRGRAIRAAVHRAFRHGGTMAPPRRPAAQH